MREPCKLRRLETTDASAFSAALTRWTRNPGFSLAPYFDEGAVFDSYLALLARHEAGGALPEGHVAHTALFGFVDGEIVGRVGVRHRLTPALDRYGGHIGFGVVPGWRRAGIATNMLRQALPVAKELGLSSVLLTCDDDNLGSIRVIERCNGRLHDVSDVDVGDQLVRVRRYWIDVE